MIVAFLGDVVGDTGRSVLYRSLPRIREEFGADAIVVNGENAAAGRGITPRLAQEFFSHGVDVITLGDHAWDQNELIDKMDELPRVLRPFNHQAGTPGYGSVIIDTPAGKLGVLCLTGRTFMPTKTENPFTHGYEEAQRLRSAGADALLVDMHAETTSEKISMGYRLEGIASAVIGTHTHVQTADERILPGGTAYLTDAGMCGSTCGVLGREREAVMQAMLTTLPCKLPVGGYPAGISGVIISIDSSTGCATDIRRINLTYDEA